MALTTMLILSGALIGAVIATALRVPAAPLVGGMAGAIIVRALGDTGPAHEGLLIAAQVSAGTWLAFQLRLTSLIEARRWLTPFVVTTATLIAGAAVAAAALSHWTGVPVRTAMLALAPGGLNEILVLGATEDAALVTSAQIVRASLIAITLRYWLPRWLPRDESRQSAPSSHVDMVKASAGAVPWRRQGPATEVLFVHRPRYDDWSLPKGGIEPGESPRDAASRETWEETGWVGTASVDLGIIWFFERHGPHGMKQVHFFAVEIDGSDGFVPNDEVDAIAWVSLDQAREWCSRPQDRDILDRFVQHLVAQTEGRKRPANPHRPNILEH